MMTLKYPEPAIHEHSGGALFTLSPQGSPACSRRHISIW